MCFNPEWKPQRYPVTMRYSWAMSAWWSPPAKKDLDDRNRLEILAALKGIENAVSLASKGSHEWADEGRAVWAMRQLQALAGAEEELRKVRVHLCVAARDSGLTLREVAEVAGTTHPTVQKWTRSPAPFVREPQGGAEQPPWVPDDDALRQIAREAGISDDVVASLLGEVEGDDDGEGD